MKAKIILENSPFKFYEVGLIKELKQKYYLWFIRVVKENKVTILKNIKFFLKEKNRVCLYWLKETDLIKLYELSNNKQEIKKVEDPLLNKESEPDIFEEAVIQKETDLLSEKGINIYRKEKNNSFFEKLSKFYWIKYINNEDFLKTLFEKKKLVPLTDIIKNINWIEIKSSMFDIYCLKQTKWYSFLYLRKNDKTLEERLSNNSIFDKSWFTFNNISTEISDKDYDYLQDKVLDKNSSLYFYNDENKLIWFSDKVINNFIEVVSVKHVFE